MEEEKNSKSKCILRVFYDFEKGAYHWDFGEHRIGCFQLVGILHAVQTDITDYNANISEEIFPEK